MLVLLVCKGNCISHDIEQNRGKKKGEMSLRDDYVSPANDIIKSVRTEKKGRVGVRKMRFNQGMGSCI